MRDASERLAYQRELIAAAKRLGLPARGDIERSFVLVGKIAGELAFHPDLFGPVFQAQRRSAGV